MTPTESKRRRPFFASCPSIPRYAATATEQIGRRVPATLRSRETLVEVLPRGRSHVRRGRKIGDSFGTSAGDVAKNLATPIGPPLWSTKACSDKPMQAICGVTGLVAPCVCAIVGGRTGGGRQRPTAIQNNSGLPQGPSLRSGAS